ncbi:E3 ubiquitin protein ligase RIE1-like isoform X2 [Silene latifolia]|uniref:E3 ubiquitin protein ligase RIE1-like isoform X2 n=1 Tax=Silene latifolia TaxID=37657 RepID=UPI003D77EBF3
MAVMYTTMAVILGRLLCSVHPLGPVRERLTRNLEKWVYSKMWVTLEILLNLIVVAVSVYFLACTARVKPNVPVWDMVLVGVPAVQCVIHVVFVMLEYLRVSRRRKLDLEADANGNGSRVLVVNGGWKSRSTRDVDFACSVYYGGQRSFAYRCDYWNLMASLVWVIFVLCWVPSPSLDKLPPWLFRLIIIYQMYDITIVMLYLIGIVVCFSLSCKFAMKQNVAGQEGVSEADLGVLPKCRLNTSSNEEEEKPSVDAGVIVPLDTGSGDSATDAECCCICLCSNDDGIDLRALSCNHRFHATCIEKWLKINATCPVCNHNILKGSGV